MAYGDSNQSYGGDIWVVPLLGMANGDKNEGPQSGIGQGNGAAPMGWAIISTPMLDIMWKQGHCTVFKALISDTEIKFVGFAFIDDKDLLKAGTVGDGGTYATIADEMQQGLDTWEGLLKAMGGALVPDKSFWYLIDFKWKEGKWWYATEDETPAILSMLDKDRVQHVITCLSSSEAHKSLGVCSAPDGNNHAQVEYM